MGKVYYHYYVEGDNEKCFLETLKTDLRYIQPGKIDKFNPVQNLFSIARIRPLKQNTIVVLIYDTDVENTDILKKNIEFLKKQSSIKDVVCIPQIHNLEDELVYSCQIKKIGNFTHSNTNSDCKRNLNSCTNLNSRLKSCGFNISKLWSRIPQNAFQIFGNSSSKIKYAHR